jgi:putative spermidine/putrescine transport system substrate-binding protein
VIGPAWQAIAELLEDGDVDVGTTLPDEGATGWSNTWMIAAEAAHPNCMYMWMDHVISPRTNAAMAEWFGEAPSNAKACAHTTDEDHCDTFHAEDEGYFDDVAYWTTPRKECGDDRGAVCKDYAEWARAWRAIGAR